MYILLIIWLLFLFLYIAFNVYGLYRIMNMRFKGDAVGRVVLFYVIVMFAIIFLSILAISQLNWGQSLPDIFGT